MPSLTSSCNQTNIILVFCLSVPSSAKISGRFSTAFANWETISYSGHATRPRRDGSAHRLGLKNPTDEPVKAKPAHLSWQASIGLPNMDSSQLSMALCKLSQPNFIKSLQNLKANQGSTTPLNAANSAWLVKLSSDCFSPMKKAKPFEVYCQHHLCKFWTGQYLFKRVSWQALQPSFSMNNFHGYLLNLNTFSADLCPVLKLFLEYKSNHLFPPPLRLQSRRSRSPRIRMRVAPIRLRRSEHGGGVDLVTLNVSVDLAKDGATNLAET
nr:hypothetical protein Iba_chr04eCG2180 [Ipomoea batatas]